MAFQNHIAERWDVSKREGFRRARAAEVFLGDCEVASRFGLGASGCFFERVDGSRRHSPPSPNSAAASLRVARAVEHLNADQRQTLRLAVIDGLSPQKIGQLHNPKVAERQGRRIGWEKINSAFDALADFYESQGRM